MANTVSIDKEIIKSAQNANLISFEQIVHVYEKPIFNFIYRMTNNIEDASDLSQESFVKVFLNLHRYDNERNFNTWIFTVAQRTVYDWLRKKRRKKELFIIDDPDVHFEPRDKKQDNYLVSQRMDIEDAMSHLKKKYQKVLHLYYWDGYTYNEIAKILHKPVNTVKTLLRRAKKIFRKEIGSYK